MTNLYSVETANTNRGLVISANMGPDHNGTWCNSGLRFCKLCYPDEELSYRGKYSYRCAKDLDDFCLKALKTRSLEEVV